MLKTLRDAFKIKDIRKKLLFTFAMLVVVRLGSQLPVPGVDRNYFVITTNVDEQFVKAGFPSEKIFATQGSYNYFQCSKACHDRLYKNTEAWTKNRR